MIRLISSVIGRICLSTIFVLAGLNKVLHWDSTMHTCLEMLSTWKGYTVPAVLQGSFELLNHHVAWFLGIAAGCELLGGILVLLGVFPRFGALLLILFLIPTTVLFHPFWELQPPSRDLQLVMCMKNLAILGGLLMVAAFGSGFHKWSCSSKSSG